MKFNGIRKKSDKIKEKEIRNELREKETGKKKKPLELQSTFYLPAKQKREFVNKLDVDDICQTEFFRFLIKKYLEGEISF